VFIEGTRLVSHVPELAESLASVVAEQVERRQELLRLWGEQLQQQGKPDVASTRPPVTSPAAPPTAPGA